MSKSDRTFHRPFSIIVEGIGPVPYERTLPSNPQMIVNFLFNRNKAEEMIKFLQEALEKEHLEMISVEITGPSP